MTNNHLTDWLEWLERESKGVLTDLTVLREIIISLRLNPIKCPVITVGGTNGKGSTVALLEAFYRAEGYRVGAFTSPHLLQYNERIRIDQIPVSDETLLTAFQTIHHALQGISCGYFAWTFLVALWIFQHAALDLFILEVGLGGRLDPTNVIDADVAAITSIDLDHCEILGNTREKIAFEKAGIFREGRPAVLGLRNIPRVLNLIATEKNIPFFALGDAFEYAVFEDHWRWFSHTVSLDALPKPALYLENAATALMIVECLQSRLPISIPSITTGLQHAMLPGRLQWISHRPGILLDVSHNPAGASLLAREIQTRRSDGDVHVIFAAQARKDLHGMIAPLLPFVGHWHVCPLQGLDGAASPSELLSILDENGVSSKVAYDSVKVAYESVIKRMSDRDVLVVFGSFHTVKEVLIFC